MRLENLKGMNFDLPLLRGLGGMVAVSGRRNAKGEEDERERGIVRRNINRTLIPSNTNSHIHRRSHRDNTIALLKGRSGDFKQVRLPTAT